MVTLKAYPNDPQLLVQLATSLEKAQGNKAERAKNLSDSIAVQEQIIRYTDDSEITGRYHVQSLFSFRKNGELDKAIDQVKKLPNLYKTRENALISFLTGDQKKAVAQEALQPLAWSISHHLSALGETKNVPQHIETARQNLDLLLEYSQDAFIMSLREQLKAKHP